MAQISTNAPLVRTGFGITKVLTEIQDFFIRLAETNARIRQIEALTALSDAELAKRGLRREDIARHVFSDLYGI